MMVGRNERLGETMGKLIVVVGGAYGSEGKGAVCGYLASRERERLLSIRVGGPQAGHTVYNEAGEAVVYQALPVASVARPDARLAIAAGSQIEWDILNREVERDTAAGLSPIPRLLVDHQATVLDPERHRDTTGGQRVISQRYGGTNKGVSRAKAARLLREAEIVGYGDREMNHGYNTGDVAEAARSWLGAGGTVLIEGVQGYGLGLHAGSYPHCTSGDCRAIDMLAMAGISPWAAEVSEFEVWVVMRTLPIRIAGNSGPLAGEMDWAEVSRRAGRTVEPEITTVTRKQRRIGEWDGLMAKEAIDANGGPDRVKVALMFWDYVDPGAANQEAPWAINHDLMNGYVKDLGREPDLLGTGPQTIINLDLDREDWMKR